MTMRRFAHALLLLLFTGLFITGCDDGAYLLTTNDIDTAGHLSRNDYLALRRRGGDAPPPVAAVPPIPEITSALVPPSAGHDRLVSVTVTNNVPLRDVLIELAREANINLELDPHIEGSVIFSAHDQAFDTVLKRICALAGLRAVQEGDFIRVEIDAPYQQTYAVDYLSLARHTTSTTAISTNVFDVNVTTSSGGSGSGSTYNGSGSEENNSTSKVSGTSDADLWGEVDKSLSQILAVAGGRADKEKDAAKFSIDRQAGLVTVFGDSRQQAAVEAYFRKLRKKANAQVLIDARIIEVELDDEFKSGINWQALMKGTIGAAASFAPASFAANGLFTATVGSGDLGGVINLVRNFGTTRVLSSPRLTVLNNQTAVLKVATNQVYFTTQAQFTTVTNANGSAVTTTPVYGPEDWTLWLQGQKWTAATDHADLHILAVEPGAVRLSVTSAGLASREITLKPHQTWQAATGNIVEGVP